MCRSVYSQKFTLIELLVLIAIIGILLSILFPSLSQTRDKVKSAVCLSQLKQINITATMYSNDQDSFIPPCWQRNESNTWFNTPWNIGALSPYFKDSPHEKVLICPAGYSDGVTMQDDRSPRDYGMNGYNWWNTGNNNARVAWALKNSNGETRGVPLKLSQIENTAGLVYFGDKKREATGQQSASGAAINGKSDTSPAGSVYNRHYGGNNFIFVDGHGKYMSQAQYFVDGLWTLSSDDKKYSFKSLHNLQEFSNLLFS